MTGHRSFEPAPECGAVYSCDDRLRGVLETVQNAVKAWSTPAFAGSHFPELADIRSGDKRTAAADQHDRFNGVIIFELLYACGDSLRHAWTQSVYRRIIYREDSHVAIFTRQH